MSTFTKTLLALTLAALIAVALVNRPIQEGRMFPALSPLMQYVLPVSDLHVPVLKEPIDVSGAKSSFEYTFTNRYVGSHAIGIMARDLPTDINRAVVPAFAFNAVLSDGDHELARCEIPRVAYSFWSKQGDGYALFTYKVPEEVPLDKPIRLRLTLTKPDAGFQSNHSPVSVYALKE